MTERLQTVTDETLKLLADVGCIPSQLPLAAYQGVSVFIEPKYRFGYLPPVWLDAGARHAIVGFCPETVVQVAGDCSDEDFALYLECCLQLLAASVGMLDDEPDAGKRQEQAEANLIDAAPDAFGVYSEIQFAAIDRGVVSSGR